MKIRVIVFAVALAAAQAFEFSKIIDKEWEAFKTNFNRKYASPDVELVRKIIFADAAYKIARHNEQYVKGLVTSTAGINKFADLVEIEVPKGLIIPGQDPDAVLKYLNVKPK